MNDNELQGLPPLLLEADEKIITVGDHNCNINGFTSQAIQTAADLLAQTGGEIKLQEGVYEITAPVTLYSDTTIEGVYGSTILRRTDGFHSPLKYDADYGELVATVQDGSRFKPGMGIAVTDSQNCEAWSVTTAVITKIEGNTLYLDSYLLRDYSAERNGMVYQCCSVIQSLNVQNVHIRNLIIDGNGKNNDPLDSCRGGGIYLHKVSNCSVENVEVKCFNGDGISFQTDYHVSILNCKVTGCTRNGIHPGAGTYWPIIKNCVSARNGQDGLFICWRVKKGVFSDNVLNENGESGLNIGHKDTDNRIEGNTMSRNYLSGIHFRKENADNAPHRCAYTKNVLEDNKHSAVFIESASKEVIFKENRFINHSENLIDLFSYGESYEKPILIDNCCEGLWNFQE